MPKNEPAGRPEKSHEISAGEPAPMDADLRRRLDELGFPRPVSLDESLAPEVDWDVLRALARNELEDEYLPLVYQLIYSFRSWRAAHTKTLVDEYLRREDSDADADAATDH